MLQNILADLCAKGLKRGCEDIEIRDEHNVKWDAKLCWGTRSPNECYLTLGWQAYCRAKGYKEGTYLQLSLFKNTPTTLYIHDT